MRKFARALLAVAVVTPLLAGNVAMAVEGSSNSSSTSSNTSSSSSSNSGSSNSSSSTTDGPLTEQQKTELAKRLSDRKTELKTKLTVAETAKIKGKCTTSQGVISSLGQRIKGIETSRTEVYNNVIDNLTKLSTKLKAKNIDTTTLDTEITTLKAKVATFNTDLTAYKQAVTDLKNMDCVTDPTAFKASLEAARTAREKVSKDAADIRTYLKDTVKVTLKDLRSQVEAKESTN